MATFLISKLGLDVTKIVEEYRMNYNPNKHTWVYLAKTNNYIYGTI